MSRTEFAAIQEKVGLTGAEIASWLLLNPSTVAAYRTGRKPIPGPVAFAMRAIDGGYRP